MQFSKAWLSKVGNQLDFHFGATMRNFAVSFFLSIKIDEGADEKGVGTSLLELSSSAGHCFQNTAVVFNNNSQQTLSGAVLLFVTWIALLIDLLKTYVSVFDFTIKTCTFFKIFISFK